MVELNYRTSCILSNYSETSEMLQKEIELIKLGPEIAYSLIRCVSREKFMKTSNYVLIEAMEQMSRHHFIPTSHNAELLTRIMIPRATLKRILGAYKNDTKDQSEPVLVKKKTPPKQNNN